MSIPLYIVSACILIAFAFITFRIVVRRSYRQRGRLTWFSSALEFFAFVSWGTFTWLDIPYEWPPADLNPILRIFALVCIVVGLSVMFVLIFRFSWSRAMGQKVDALVQSGLYRFTRNPQTVACGIAVIGYALLWPSWHTLGWVVLFFVIVHLMILTEEEHLREVFGEEYIQYSARVPRYIGFRKKRIH